MILLEPWLEGGASHFLRREGRALRFADAGVWVDLDEHAHLTARARSHSAAGRIDEAVAALGEAAALYRGDLLDPEDRYEAWAEAARERWRRAQREALVEVSHLLAARGDYEPAAQECARALEGGLGVSPETATRRLLEEVRPRA